MFSSPDKIVIISMLLQVFLTFSVMIVMGRRRFAAAREGSLQIHDFKTMQLNHAPEQVLLASRNFENQFEIPVLFYVVCLLAMHLNTTSWFFAICALLFVLSRVAHSVVHLTYNKVRARFRLFLLGCTFIVIQWLALAVTLI
ncbi:membrane protein [Pseudoalteromonas sp. A25]|uniref:MAPEG family protein n=1 Tax=Pseudoalteromonas sp. A25 TaxID=116092 RepID=UPI00126045A0|nr:MAPEG family protein [Pseudoalteromonas sp. A25]BBN83411.1 membrane protein [Pseudoalteromonas sp. A25]